MVFIYTSRMRFQKRVGIIHGGTDLRVGDIVPADCTHRGRLHQHRSIRINGRIVAGEQETMFVPVAASSIERLARGSAAGDASARTGAGKGLVDALWRDKPIRKANRWPKQDDYPQIFSPHFQRGTAHPVCEASRRSSAPVEDQRIRLQGARLLGRLRRSV